jgi:hypothetical protein
VAHVRQEGAFRDVRRLRLLARFLKLGGAPGNEVFEVMAVLVKFAAYLTAT